MKKILVAILMLSLGLALMLAGCQATRAGYESAAYKVVRAEGKFEVRDYPALTVVETGMTGNGDNADGSFNRLFGFITGRNTAKQKIAMTTPVFVSGSESNRTMAFVLPAKIHGGQAPKPSDDAVVVRALAPGRFAVLRYSGGRNQQKEEAALERLNIWMTAAGLTTASPPVYGYFDPPWTPAFLRRNEVMLRIGPAP